ncbi:MAG TPA: hypothetical protein EYP25_04465, partial [Anaerolineae bacterium]|nr:hypothetical protein [Anaerolineae bacterium]
MKQAEVANEERVGRRDTALAEQINQKLEAMTQTDQELPEMFHQTLSWGPAKLAEVLNCLAQELTTLTVTRAEINQLVKRISLPPTVKRWFDSLSVDLGRAPLPRRNLINLLLLTATLLSTVSFVTACATEPAEVQSINTSPSDGDQPTPQKPTLEPGRTATNPPEASPEATATPTAEEIKGVVVKWMVEKGLIISSDVIETVDQLGVDANNSPKKLFILKVTDQATDTDGSLPPGSFILIDITGMTHNNFMDLDPAKIYTPVTVNGAPVLMFGALSGIGGEGVGDLSSQFKQVVTQAFYVQWQEDDQGQTKPTIPNSSLRFNQEANRIELVVKVKTDKQEDDVVVAYVDNNTREWMPVETRLVMPDGAILRYEINPAGENVWVIDNQALQVGDQIVEFDLAGNMLTLRTPEAAQTLTFPSDIVQVEAQDQ